MHEQEDIITLVRRAQQGDQHALQSIYLAEYRQVYYLTLGVLHDIGEAEDACQETFLAAFQHLEQLQNPLALHQWLLQIASNKCKNKLRKKQDILTEQENLLNNMEEEDAFLLPGNSLDDDETRKMILGVIHSLPEKQRQTVLYYYYSQLTVLQVAELMECSEGTVKSRLATARQSIRAELERMNREDGVKLYSGAPLALLPILQQAAQSIQLPAGALENGWAVLQAAVSPPVIPHRARWTGHAATQGMGPIAKGISGVKLAAITAGVLVASITLGTAGALWVNSHSGLQAGNLTLPGNTEIVSKSISGSNPDILPTEITKWVVEPFLEAEDIIPVIGPKEFDEYNANIFAEEITKQKMSEGYFHKVNIIQQNGKQGLVDLEGNTVLSIKYESLYYYEGVIVFWENNELYRLDDNYLSTEHSGPLSAATLSWEWDSVRQRPYNMGGQEFSMREIYPNQIVPVRVVSINYDALTTTSLQENGMSYVLYNDIYGDGVEPYSGDYRNSKFGYATNDQLIINAEYDSAQFMAEGIGAVRKADSWWYITPDGTIINSTPYSDVAGENEIFPSHGAYNFSEGLVAVNRDGLWGYMDKNGAEVIPCQYQATRPVYQGKAWVKVNGLWGVADLSDYVSK